MKISLLLLALFVSLNSEAICKAQRVELSDASIWNSVVQIEAPAGNCSAVIVNSKLLLTAAHCFIGSNPTKLRSLKINSVGRNSAKTNVSLVKANWLPQFDRAYANKPTPDRTRYDFAYVLLKDSIFNNKALKGKIALAKVASYTPMINDPRPPVYTSVGTGQSHLDSTRSDNGKLRKLEMNVFDDAANSIYRAWPSSDACVCEGDSGGGLFANASLIGIQSAAVGTNPCGGSHSVAFLVKVSDHLSWIQQETGIQLIP